MELFFKSINICTMKTKNKKQISSSDLKTQIRTNYGKKMDILHACTHTLTQILYYYILSELVRLDLKT